jgi:hypothetical protein
MSAIAETFPSAINLLCIWYVNKNVMIHAKKCLPTRENAEDALQRWRRLLESESIKDFDKSWAEIQSDFGAQSAFI